MLQQLLRTLLPGACLLCDSPLATAHTGPDLCRFCHAALPWNRHPCRRCGEPLAPGRVGVDALCAACRRRPPPFLLTVAPLCYHAEARTWVGRLKDRLGMVEGRILGTLLADAAERCYADPRVPRPAALIPVPLSALRLAWRGHNQALTLALPVARRLQVPVLRRAVARCRGGRPQRGLRRLQRLDNSSGRFVSRRRWDNGPCLAIVDDVMTTGATAAELARVLLDAGAGEIHVLSATRTPPLTVPGSINAYSLPHLKGGVQ